MRAPQGVARALRSHKVSRPLKAERRAAENFTLKGERGALRCRATVAREARTDTPPLTPLSLPLQ
jgi:hypothetical protein